MRLVLASASPRRAELLRAAGFSFEALSVDVDERLRPAEGAASYVRRLAAEKSALALDALRVTSLAQSPTVVIGADTVVVVDDDILGKPGDDDRARGMLRRLSGRTHEVVTGVSVRTEEREATSVDVTRVWFTPLTDREIDWYEATGECRDKAGAYAIQGGAARFISRIEGSYSNVVGLPVATVHALLRQLGL